MTKGTIIIDGQVEMERLVSLLANDFYEVRVRKEDGIDWTTCSYRVDYKRKDEFDEG